MTIDQDRFPTADLGAPLLFFLPNLFQSQLDIVLLFCNVFGMKVNVRKTEIIILWTKEMKLRMAR